MKVRRKSLWRSKNAKHYRYRANQRAAKERKRLERVAREETMPDTSGCYVHAKDKPLFTITIRCRDGELVKLRISDGYFGLFPSVTKAVEKIRCVLTNYRPIPA